MITCPALVEIMQPLLQEERTDHLKEQIRKKLLKNKSAEVIADELEEEDINKIRRLIEEISKEKNTDTIIN